MTKNTASEIEFVSKMCFYNKKDCFYPNGMLSVFMLKVVMPSVIAPIIVSKGEETSCVC